jgi:hypothetical protein
MPIERDELVRIAHRVAARVRRLVPRSSNRYLAAGAGESDWLHDTSQVRYTEFLLAVVRAGTKGKGQDTIKQEVTTGPIWWSTTTSQDVSVKAIRKAVLDFIKTETIDGRPIDLNYKPGLATEKAYSDKFAAKLADFLNARGLRHKGERFSAPRVLSKIVNELTENERVSQAFRRPYGEALRDVYLRPKPDLMFPPRYIAASARNACKYGLGNCEECGCLAFALLVTLRRPDDTPLATFAAGEARPRVELVRAIDGQQFTHFFVLVNRTGTSDITDFTSWFDNPDTIACDPWIADGGAGGSITDTSDAGVRELRNYLSPGVGQRPSFLRVWATGSLGQVPEDFKDNANFRIPDA